MASDIERLIRKQDKCTITYSGSERTYLFYIPEYTDRSNLPLLVLLHGGGANAENAMRMAQIEALADKQGFYVLYPDGYGNESDRVYTWNAGNCCGPAKEDGSDDVGFLRHLLKSVCASYSVNTDHIMMAGFSNGAMMAHRFGIEASLSVSSIAAVGGGLNFSGKIPSMPVSVLSVHGLLDEHAPYQGGCGKKTRYPRVDFSVHDGVKKWADWNGCRNYERALLMHGEAETHFFTSENKAVAVSEYVFKKQGHAWPGGKMGLRYGNVDEPVAWWSASEEIYRFMMKFPRKTEYGE